MKRLVLASLYLVSMLPYLAYAAERPYDFTETARVVSSRPIYENVGRPRRECWDEEVIEREQGRYEDERERGLGGTIIGGIAGGILGNQVGKGSGKTAATAVGAVTGAVVGDRIENSDRGDRYHGDRERTRVVQRCREVEDVREEVSGYSVTYKFNGRTHTTRMRRDPGSSVRIGITILDDR